MKILKLILVVVLLFAVFNSQGQIYLGYTETEIRSSIAINEKLETKNLPSGQKVLLLTYVNNDNHYSKFYFMDRQSGQCYMYVVEPLNEDAFQSFLFVCNNEYEKISSSKWLIKLNGLLINVNLRNKKMFYFSIEQPRKPIIKAPHYLATQFVSK